MAHRPGDGPRALAYRCLGSRELRFPSGGLAQFVASFGASAVDNYRVVEHRRSRLDPGFQLRDRDQVALASQWRDYRDPVPQIDQFSAPKSPTFLIGIAAGTPPEADGEEGLADLRRR